MIFDLKLCTSTERLQYFAKSKKLGSQSISGTSSEVTHYFGKLCKKYRNYLGIFVGTFVKGLGMFYMHTIGIHSPKTFCCLRISDIGSTSVAGFGPLG